MSPARFAERLDRSGVDKASERSEQTPSTTPLVVGAADDRAEVEADRVAHEVIARLHGTDGGSADHAHSADFGHSDVRRSAGPSGAAEVGYEGGAVSDDLSSRIEGKRGGGSSLPSAVRSRMETGFGGSLADVRIHTDQESAGLNRAVSARAFTTGKDIFFGAGEYRPDTAEGETVLAHEIAHARQQGAGARRTIRRWNLKSKKLTMNDGIDVYTLPSRPIWFVKDDDKDEIVVKADDQPTGLGLLAGAMHKNITKVKSVHQRKLEKKDTKELERLIEIRSWSDAFDPSWTKRGDLLKQQDATIDATRPSAEVAKDDAIAQLNDPTKSVIAMSVADGEDAKAATEFDATKGGMADDRSTFRKLLMDPAHVALLGKMTAIDLFLGNQDRVANANLGNWFYNPSGSITLLDHVDPGQQGAPATAMSAGYRTHADWEKHAADKLKDNAVSNHVWSLVRGAVSDPNDPNPDLDILTWAKATPTGENRTRKQMMEESFGAGLAAGRTQIRKVFATTKWSLFSPKRHAAKKSIRSAAKKGAVEDGGAANYYAELKERAKWLKANTP